MHQKGVLYLEALFRINLAEALMSQYMLQLLTWSSVLTLLHSEWSKLYGVLTILSAIRLNISALNFVIHLE